MELIWPAMRDPGRSRRGWKLGNIPLGQPAADLGDDRRQSSCGAAGAARPGGDGRIVRAGGGSDGAAGAGPASGAGDRKRAVWGTDVNVGSDLGGRRIFKKKKN